MECFLMTSKGPWTCQTSKEGGIESRWFEWEKGDNGTGRVKCGNIWDGRVEDRVLKGTLGTDDFGRSHQETCCSKSFLNHIYDYIYIYKRSYPIMERQFLFQ